MKNMKKFLVVLLTSALLFTSGTTALAKNPKHSQLETVIPPHSVYEFVYDLPDYILSDQDTTVKVSYKTKTTGQTGYEDVHFEFAASCLQAADGTNDGHVTFKATDSNSTAYTFLDEGIWGPPEGFDLPATYNAATDWTLNFSEAGTYRIVFQAVDGSDNIITEKSQDLTVQDAVFVYEVPENIESNQYAAFNVGFVTNQQYEDVRFEFKAEGPGNVEFKAQDSAGVWYTFTNQGSWGSWFDITGGYNITTPWQIKFSEDGTYNIFFKLTNENGTVFASGSETVVVTDPAANEEDENDEDGEEENNGKGNTHGLLNALRNHVKERNNNANANARMRSIQRLMELLQARGISETELDEALGIMKELMKSTRDCSADDYRLLGKMHELKGKKFATYIDGEETEFDVPPILQEGRTLVPFRKIAEALGAEVSWNPEEKTVVVIKGDKYIQLKIDEKTALVNGSETALDVPALIHKNRTLIPLRFIAEALETTVDYYPEGSLIVIKKRALK